MHRVRRHRAPSGRLQHPLLDHQPRTVVPLLSRLEHEHHVTAQPVPPLGEQPGRTDQHGRVQVVPAGMHPALDLGRVRDAALLRQGQRVHVGTQEHDGTVTVARVRAPAAQHGGDRGQPAAGRDLQGQSVERREHLGLGPRQIEAGFRLPVEVLTQPYEILHQAGARPAAAHLTAVMMPCGVMASVQRVRRTSPNPTSFSDFS